MATKRQSATKSDSPVAARAQAEEAKGDQGSRDLEAEAKQQERQQRQELREGKGSQAPVRERERIYDKGKGDRASLRTPVGLAHNRGGAQGGVVDNMSRRHDGDALEGHFVSIDLQNKDAREAVKAAINGNLPEDQHVDPTPFNGGYGVYLDAADVNRDTGYPLTANVRLRDSSNARVVVPYEALSPADAGHR